MAGPRRRPSDKERLAAFDRSRDDLLAILQAACKKTKLFDAKNTWRALRFEASVYLRNEARIEKQRARPPTAVRKRFDQLGTALRRARSELKRTWKDDNCGRLFVEWCEAHGNPDFTDPVISAFERGFEKEVGGVLAALASLEQAAVRAGEQSFQRTRGRPGGTSILPHDFILSLEGIYRRSTGNRAGAGAGPFARLMVKFLEALQRRMAEQSVIDAIKAAKNRDANTWWNSEPLPLFNDLSKALEKRGGLLGSF
jgi:hypothetical protein